MKRWVVLSILLHLIPVAFLWKLTALKVLEVRAPRSVWVTRSEPTGSKSSQSLRSSFRPRKAEKPALKKLGLFSGASLYQVHPKGSENRSENAYGSSNGRAGGGRGGREDGYDFAAKMNAVQEGKLYPFFEAIWRRIDANLTYPSDFVAQRITGDVTVQLDVDRRGVFAGHIPTVRGSDPLLNTFVLATLIQSLRSPLRENYWMKEDADLPETDLYPRAKVKAEDRAFLLVFHFKFTLYTSGRTPEKVEVAHFKNLLEFRRDVYAEPVANQLYDQIFTRYIPPILPFPGGVILDVPRAIRFFKNLSKPEPDQYKLRDQRIEIQSEVWDSIIRKATQP